jgi:hypothetical protein
MEEFVNYATKNLVPLVPLVFALAMASQIIVTIVSRMGKKPKIHIYPAGNVEIGLSQHGPTVALFGTLRVQNADAFISKIEVVVSKIDSAWSRILEWRAFKPYTFSMIPHDEMKWELISAFLVTTQAPFKFNIVFVDDPFLVEYSPHVLKIRSLWETYKKDASDKTASPQLFVEEFLKTEEVQDTVMNLKKASYWEPGKYTLKMLVYTSNPNKFHKTVFEFTLSQEQSEVLEGNVIKVLQLVCGMDVACEYVYPAYKLA